MTAIEAIAFLEAEAKRVFDDGVFHQDEVGTFSAHEKERDTLEAAADVLRSLHLTWCEVCGAEIAHDQARLCTNACLGHPDQYEDVTCCAECAGE